MHETCEEEEAIARERTVKIEKKERKRDISRERWNREMTSNEFSKIQSEIHELSRKIIENSHGLTYLIDKSSQLNDRITYLETRTIHEMSELRRHASELEEKIMEYIIMMTLIK